MWNFTQLLFLHVDYGRASISVVDCRNDEYAVFGTLEQQKWFKKKNIFSTQYKKFI